MRHCYRVTLLIWILALAHATASQVDFLFSGHITFSRDDAGWLSEALPENSIFNGRIRYDTSLSSGEYHGLNDPRFAQYRFYPDPGSPPAMSVTDINGHSFSSATEFFVNTYDNYGLNPSVPGIVPFDQIFYTTYGNFNFDGSALTVPYQSQFAGFGVYFDSSLLTSTTSDALPLDAPNLAAFANSYIDIFLIGFGENPPIAFYQGVITSVTPVPEPAAAALFLLGACVWILRRK